MSLKDSLGRVAALPGGLYNVYRVCPERYQRTLLSMRGAYEFGGRYNVKGYFGALYTSLDSTTALREMQRHYNAVDPYQKLIEAAIEVRLSHVVDLTKRTTLSSLRMSRGHLRGDSWSATQALGQCAWELGMEGLLVPSAFVRGGTNLVILLDNQLVRWRVHLRRVR